MSNLDFEAWRCKHEKEGENLFCPDDGCSKERGCARERRGVCSAKIGDLLVALETIALHAPSLDVTGIREICDGAIAKAKGESK